MKKIIYVILLLILVLNFTDLFAKEIWRDDFKDVQNWYDNKVDSSFGAVIVKGKKKGTAEIIQKGKGTWGKVAFVLSNIDLDKYNVLRMKVNKVSKNGDYKILITSINWRKTFELIERGSGKGIHEGYIKQITGWSGKKTFNIVVVVEGKKKKVVLDWIELVSEKNEE